LLLVSIWKAKKPTAIAATAVLAISTDLKRLGELALGVVPESCDSIDSPLLLAVETL
jgi:hypothetical protein